MGDHYRQLSVEERVNIMLRLRDGMSSRAIARELKHALDDYTRD